MDFVRNQNSTQGKPKVEIPWNPGWFLQDWLGRGKVFLHKTLTWQHQTTPCLRDQPMPQTTPSESRPWPTRANYPMLQHDYALTCNNYNAFHVHYYFRDWVLWFKIIRQFPVPLVAATPMRRFETFGVVAAGDFTANWSSLANLNGHWSSLSITSLAKKAYKYAGAGEGTVATAWGWRIDNATCDHSHRHPTSSKVVCFFTADIVSHNQSMQISSPLAVKGQSKTRDEWQPKWKSCLRTVPEHSHYTLLYHWWLIITML